MGLRVGAQVGWRGGEETGGEWWGLGLEEGRGTEVREVGPWGVRRAGGGTGPVGLLWRVVRCHV